MSNDNDDSTPFMGGLHDLLDQFALGYSNEPTQVLREHCHQFFIGLSDMMPCDKCRLKMSLLLREYPINLYSESIEKLQEWIAMFKERVNSNEFNTESNENSKQVVQVLTKRTIRKKIQNQLKGSFVFCSSCYTICCWSTRCISGTSKTCSTFFGNIILII